MQNQRDWLRHKPSYNLKYQGFFFFPHPGQSAKDKGAATEESGRKSTVLVSASLSHSNQQICNLAIAKRANQVACLSPKAGKEPQTVLAADFQMTKQASQSQ